MNVCLLHTPQGRGQVLQLNSQQLFKEAALILEGWVVGCALLQLI